MVNKPRTEKKKTIKPSIPLIKLQFENPKESYYGSVGETKIRPTQ
jgi:hypothetical protein